MLIYSQRGVFPNSRIYVIAPRKEVQRLLKSVLGVEGYIYPQNVFWGMTYWNWIFGLER